MPNPTITSTVHKNSWEGIRRGRNSRPLEWIAERLIFGVSFSAIAVVFLIFIFVGKEALPIFLGQTDSRAIQSIIPAADIDKTPPDVLRKYLGLDKVQFESMDRDGKKDMMQLREDSMKEMPDSVRNDPDATNNTTSIRFLVAPHQWQGYDQPVYIWQPVGSIQKFNLIPLLIGSLKTTLIGLLFAVPLAIGAAVYVSQLASPRTKEWVKPAIELLSGIPSVVIGTFALIVLASFFQGIFHYQTRLNAFVAGIALGFAVIPLVFSIAEDALSSVPKSYVQAALAVGASRWEAAKDIVLPAALPGVFAAVVLGFGRAIGETMIVLLVCSASVVSWNVFDSARSITTTIAAEMGELVSGSPHYQILFMLGTLLFGVTFVTNLFGDVVMHQLKRRIEGKK
jgi:phosphate transport system permease protein